MKNKAWEDLVKIIEGKKLNYQPAGFISDRALKLAKGN
jgi:hypothetical protein